MNESKLGSLIEQDEQRDAVHIAICPVVAAELLQPGTHVGIVDGKATANAELLVGVVDPFLRHPVEAGERFWICLYPLTVSSIRHDWTHPAFSEKDPVITNDKEKAEAWLRAYAMMLNEYDDPATAFQRLIDDLGNGLVVKYGSDAYGESDFERTDELKAHAERYLGRSINWNNVEFTCQC